MMTTMTTTAATAAARGSVSSRRNSANPPAASSLAAGAIPLTAIPPSGSVVDYPALDRDRREIAHVARPGGIVCGAVVVRRGSRPPIPSRSGNSPQHPAPSRRRARLALLSPAGDAIVAVNVRASAGEQPEYTFHLRDLGRPDSQGAASTPRSASASPFTGAMNWPASRRTTR